MTTRIIAAAFLLSLAAGAQADPAATFKSKCAMCHGPEGKGTKIAPNAIGGVPADQVKKAVTEGKGKMKPVKIDDVDDVAGFVAGLPK